MRTKPEEKPMIKILWIGLIISCVFLQSLAQDAQPLDDLDNLYFGFAGVPREFPTPFMADFVAIKLYYVTGNERPDINNPTALYARVTYDVSNEFGREGVNEMVRVAFNGTPLFKQTTPSGRTYYGTKRPLDPKEDWLSWYAHLGVAHLPFSIAFDNVSGGSPSVGFELSFPPPYHLSGVADSITLGGSDWTYEVEPALAPESLPEYGSMRLYPSRTQQEEAIFLSNDFPNPGTISHTVAKGSMADLSSVGWGTGVKEGFAAFGACNDDTVDYAGGKRLWFRACTITLKPVMINVTEAQN
jgi:hypothetical protein